MDRKYVLKEILSWAQYMAAAFIFAFIINHTVLVNAQVTSGSMESTIMTGDRIFANRLAYATQDPKRFDIVVFKFPDNEASNPFVKRVIGLPGEKVEIKNGKVFINDATTPLDDFFTNEETNGDYGPFFVPEDSYFMLGDNRNNSWDSKNWIHTFVSKDKILGKAVVGWFPHAKIF